MASTDLVVLDNTITYQGSGKPTLDGLIIATLNRDNTMPDHKMYMGLMKYTDSTLINPDQTYSAKSAPKGLQDVEETGLKKRVDFVFQPKKGVYQREIGGEFSSSYLFTQWARNAKNIEGAPDAIQAELADIASQTRDLVLAYDIRYAEEMVKLWTKGFSVTAPNGPGSATPKGNPLFYASHPYGVPGSLVTGTFSNIVTGSPYADIATGTTKLQSALDLLKQTRDDNGKYITVPRGEPYMLYCSRVREVFWKQVLNNSSNFSGQGNNAMQENQFLFNGNIVQINVLDLLGQPDEDGTTIGTTDYWFLMNPTYVTWAKALRTYRLYQPRVKSFENMETDEQQTSIRAVVGVDHYGAELGLVGSVGA